MSAGDEVVHLVDNRPADIDPVFDEHGHEGLTKGPEGLRRGVGVNHAEVVAGAVAGVVETALGRAEVHAAKEIQDLLVLGGVHAGRGEMDNDRHRRQLCAGWGRSPSWPRKSIWS